MKSREIIAWTLLIICLILLFQTCGKQGKYQIITGKTDTIVRIDTMVVSRETKPVIKKVYVYTPTTSDTIYQSIFAVNPCDSVREYEDSLSQSGIKASVRSTVRGEILNQNIRLEAILNDTLFSRVDTLIKKIPYKFSLSAVAYGDLYNGPGIGASCDIKRFRFGYGYFPLKQSHQISVGYRILGF